MPVAALEAGQKPEGQPKLSGKPAYRPGMEDRHPRSDHDPRAYAAIRRTPSGVDLAVQNGALHEVFIGREIAGPDFDPVKFVKSAFQGKDFVAAGVSTPDAPVEERQFVTRLREQQITPFVVDKAARDLDPAQIARQLMTEVRRDGTTAASPEDLRHWYPIRLAEDGTESPQQEEEKPPFTIASIFKTAAEYRQHGDARGNIPSKQDALELALLEAATTDDPPFKSKTAERDDIHLLGVPGIIDPKALLEYVSSNSGIPKEDPIHPTEINPAYDAFQERQHVAAESAMFAAARRGAQPRERSSSQWATALSLLEVAWDYHEQKPAIQAAIDERDAVIAENAKAAGVEPEKLISLMGRASVVSDTVNKPAGVTHVSEDLEVTNVTGGDENILRSTPVVFMANGRTTYTHHEPFGHQGYKSYQELGSDAYVNQDPNVPRDPSAPLD